MPSVLPQPRSLAAGFLAGLVGGILIAVALLVMSRLLLHADVTLAGFFQSDAALVVGKTAYGSPAYAALGAAFHVLVSIGWAVGYAYMAERESQLVTRPLTSGAGFGVVVYFVMQLVLVAGNAYHIPAPAELGVALTAHIVFFGIPVASIVARALRAR
ncbi:MAG: hypothetical protein ABR591_10745 [Candidatus Velthaea sp.]